MTDLSAICPSFTPDELAAIRQQATARGVSPDEFVRAVVLKELAASGAVRSDADDEAPTDQRDELLDWLAAHPDALARYRGQWVAFNGWLIVASAPSFDGAVALAKASGVDDPLLVPVLDDRVDALVELHEQIRRANFTLPRGD